MYISLSTSVIVVVTLVIYGSFCYLLGHEYDIQGCVFRPLPHHGLEGHSIEMLQKELKRRKDNRTWLILYDDDALNQQIRYLKYYEDRKKI